MNSIWNKNYSLFKERFPELSNSLEVKFSNEIEIETAKNGSVTAKRKNLLLHSKYNPEKEADSLINSFDSEKKDTAIFLGFGLGYGLVEFAKKFPEPTLIIIEEDTASFFSALSAIDWSPVFEHKKLIFIIGASLEQTSVLISNCSYSKTHIFKTKSHTAHNQEYFDSVENIIFQNKQKEEVNTNTLEKFSRLWLSNSCKNLDYIEKLDGVNKFLNIANGIPFVIIAAGPSLEKILPHLNEIKERAIIVCVDTALHSCLEFNVEPDFIILADPQYYCSLHLEFLKSPESILVTEIAVYPSVFRFQCKEIVLFSSMFPIGKFFEKNIGEKGLLAAGGSVATTAWDFARMCGASEIYLAGMDLGFPSKKTHIRGSKFEEKIHCESSRTKTAETKNIQTLFSAAPFYAKDYNGNEILTDKKMQLFSWWFEKNCTSASAQGIKTFSLTPESLAINGIEKLSLEEFLLKPIAKDRRKILFEKAQENKKKLSTPKGISFEQQKKQFGENLKILESLAKRGIHLCNKALRSPLAIPEVFGKLNEIDQKISSSSAKDAAALVFPTQRQLDSLSEKIPNNSEAEKKLYSIRYSNLIYTELLKSINLYKKFFPNSN
ncbi:MAG: DUF115 domain-containing protein [Spirochaetales bacterium]|nr:DUF115 domain-containing protein [Spirochaetales bacterium]